MSSYPIVLTEEFQIALFRVHALSRVRCGISSWAYEDWQGMVYQQIYPKSRSSQDTVAENASDAVDGAPLLFTIFITHSFY